MLVKAGRGMVGYVDGAPGAGVATRSIGTCWPDRGSQVPRECLTSRRRLAERGSEHAISRGRRDNRKDAVRVLTTARSRVN